MNDAIPPLPPPMLLAIAYAPAVVRERLRLLLLFDQRIASVVQRTSEVMIAQLRLSWWRDALNAPVEKRPKGEPLLAALGGVEPDAPLKTAALQLVDAMEMLAVAETDDGQRHGQEQRRAAIAAAYGQWIGQTQDEAQAIGRLLLWWGDVNQPPAYPIPRQLRPLSILALAERIEGEGGRFAGLRLSWHALTGR